MSDYSKLARKKVENHIGRTLFSTHTLGVGYPNIKLYDDIDEVIHHINRDQSDNRPENLYVFRNTRKHADYHNEIRKWSFGLCGKTLEEKIAYLSTFPDLKSNLNHLKELSEKGMELSEYVDENPNVNPNLRR